MAEGESFAPPTMTAEEERESNIGFVDVEQTAPPPTYEKPSIEKAWAFYYSSLPKRIAVIKSKGIAVGADGKLGYGNDPHAQQSDKGTGFRQARAGETHDEITGNPAMPYSLFGNYKELDEFGIGISLYFRQLALLGVVVSICALINLSTISKNSATNPPDTPSTLVGSVLGTTREQLSFGDQGTADILTCVILFLFVLFMKKFEDRNIEAIDLAQQTPQDYAIRVKNLPKHITDPDTYHQFFSKWGDVVFVTIAKDNGPLLKKIADLKELELVMEAKEATDVIATLAGKEVLKQADLTADQINKQKFLGMYMTMDKLKEQEGAIRAEIETLSKATYDPRVAFVVFNKERDQRMCLKDCATGLLEQAFNVECSCTSKTSSTMEGHVLTIIEPVEPSEVIYENLHVKTIQYWIGLFKSYTITFFVLWISFLILQNLTVSSADIAAGKGSSTGAALFVCFLNGGLPTFLKMLTSSMEIHVDEGDFQTSILRKLMIARCMNTAVLIYMVTGYVDVFGQANLSQIQSILIADCFTTPAMRMMNLFEHFNHKVVAPTKQTQSQMNVLFRGAYWNLAERYTDMIKTVFVGLFYSTIIPSSLFVTATAMFTTYIVDKYCLLRMWERPPMYDETMAITSRKMIVICVWIHMVMAMHFFANWPYQNEEEESKCGLFQCTDPGVWTVEQRAVVKTYQSTGASLFTLCVFYLFWKKVATNIKKLFFQSVDEVGQASEIQFRNLTGVSAYVPQVRRATMTDPMFVCNVSGIPRTYVPCRPTTLDGQILDPNELSVSNAGTLPFLNTQFDMDQCFSVCKYYRAPAAGAGVGAGQVAVNMNMNRGGNVQMGNINPQQQQQMFAQQQQQQTMQAQQQLQAQQQEAMRVQQMHQQQQMQTAAAVGQPLPAGWEAKQDPGSGKTYYVNHETKATQWTRPQYQVAGKVGRRGSGLGKLPAGWEMKHTAEGKPYFVNHATKKTQWTMPNA